MILTEKEAMLKSCVHWAPLNPDWGIDSCKASQCMAWRWVPDKDGETGTLSRLSWSIRMKKVGDEYHEVGFCGLAGKPWGVE